MTTAALIDKVVATAPVVRAEPTPDAVHQTFEPLLSKLSRDELLFNMKKARTWPAGKNQMADAVMAEWDGRVKYWADRADAHVKAAVQSVVNAEHEFFNEVKEALIAEGKADHVATALISTEAKLMVQARRLGII